MVIPARPRNAEIYTFSVMDEWVRRHQAAIENHNLTATNFNQVQDNAAKERAQFFDKLAIGCGATIAAIVSFLGSSSTHILNPRWAMRWALASLLLAICAAWFRNLRYPGYPLAVSQRAWEQAALAEQTATNDLIKGGVPLVDGTGQRVSPIEWFKHHAATYPLWAESIAKLERSEKRKMREYRVAEEVALLATVLAVALLVLIAFRTF